MLRQLFTSPISLLEITEEHVKCNSKYLIRRWGNNLERWGTQKRWGKNANYCSYCVTIFTRSCWMKSKETQFYNQILSEKETESQNQLRESHKKSKAGPRTKVHFLWLLTHKVITLPLRGGMIQSKSSTEQIKSKSPQISVLLIMALRFYNWDLRDYKLVGPSSKESSL